MRGPLKETGREGTCKSLLIYRYHLKTQNKKGREKLWRKMCFKKVMKLRCRNGLKADQYNLRCNIIETQNS